MIINIVAIIFHVFNLTSTMKMKSIKGERGVKMERNNVERTIHISVNSYILAPKNNDNEALAAAPPYPPKNTHHREKFVSTKLTSSLV